MPEKEGDLTDLFDLYLMGEKWAIAALVRDVLDAVRRFYRQTESYPSLRRVQYIYSQSPSTSPMRQLLVGSIARMLLTEDKGIPKHWDKALQKNGQLAVDLIRAMQEWRVSGDEIPDPREEPTEGEREGVRAVEDAEREQDGTARDMGGEETSLISEDGESESTLNE